LNVLANAGRPPRWTATAEEGPAPQGAVTSRTVRVGQEWSYEEPNGVRRTFTVRSLQHGPNLRRFVRGLDTRGRIVMVGLVRLENGAMGARLERDV
jgi:hypothetical protein